MDLKRAPPGWIGSLPANQLVQPGHLQGVGEKNREGQRGHSLFQNKVWIFNKYRFPPIFCSFPPWYLLKNNARVFRTWGGLFFSGKEVDCGGKAFEKIAGWALHQWFGGRRQPDPHHFMRTGVEQLRGLQAGCR